MNCPYWNEIKFIKHCHNELSAKEELQIQAHLEKCLECREYFTLMWEVILDTSSAAILVDDDIDKFLASPRWQKQKKALIDQHSNAIIEQLNKRAANVSTFLPNKQRRDRSRYLVTTSFTRAANIVPKTAGRG
ncbi:MAG: zf-HC2 domain-containing protein [Acidobacteriota bacterium]